MPGETFDKFAFYWSLATATDLSDTEFRVLVLLANFADGTTGRRAYPSAATLAEQAGKSDKTVRRALAALVTKGRLVKTDRAGQSAEYQLVTLDTQMSRVTDTNPGHPDVQGPGDTLDKSLTTLDTQMSTHPGHPDVHRSDQLPDPDNRSGSGLTDQFRAGDIPKGDVQPGGDQDETGPWSRSLADAGPEHDQRSCDGRGQDGPSLREAASAPAAEQPADRQAVPATAPQRVASLRPPAAVLPPFEDPFASEPAWLTEARAREARREPATAAGRLPSPWED